MSDIDPDATGYIEPPETPAPVFAVRAFKHAIFGTPQTVQPKPRRHSNTENARSRPHGSRPERPGIARPKSASDARTFANEDQVLVPEPVSSPTKGILMTPGTAATKRKTVTFGEHVTDNQEKRPVKSGLPDDCPGKFPSPWTKPGAEEDQADELMEKSRGRSKLTEALEQARDESVKRKKRSRNTEDDDMTKEFQEPKSESGRYWKMQYDVYRENSQREVRKLITKQKAAKSFAKDKDFQCTELADQLRQEKKKAERLEKRTAELEEQLRIMQKQLANTTDSGPKSQTAEVKPVLEAMRSYRRDPRNQPPRDQPRPLPPAQAVRGNAGIQAEVTIAQPPQPPAKEERKAEPEPPNYRPKARPDNIRTKTEDDIWAQSFGSSSPVLGRSVQQPPTSPKHGRAVTSGTDSTPLKSLSINTLPTANLTRRDSAQISPPTDRFAKEPLVRQEVARSPRPDDQRKDSPVLSPGLPQPSREVAAEPQQAPQSPAARKPAAFEVTDDISIPVPVSSPFLASPMLSPPGVDTKKSTSYFDRKAQAAPSRATASPSMKENVSPSAKAAPVQTENVKPTAAWNAINAPMAGKRVTSLTDKNGRELGLDRIEAAKARMAARGRVLS